MKAKITSIAFFVLSAYLLPLSGKITLLPTIQVSILVLFVIVLFATQPPLRIMEAKEDKQSDKNSVIFIILGYFIGQLATIIEWAYFSGYHKWIWDGQTILGLCLMIGGTMFRVWCIRTLGKFFTATVKTQEKQEIITTGAYKLVRHPSYSGAYIAAIGSSLFLHAWVALFLTAVVLSIAYYFRIRAEEETLVREFGEEYKEYQTRTNKLVPFLY
jgi:protein-S-isoprenylcysteine O-methyltransferase Ste14